MYLHNVRGINPLNGGSKLPNNINQTEQVNTTLIDKKKKSITSFEWATEISCSSERAGGR